MKARTAWTAVIAVAAAASLISLAAAVMADGIARILYAITAAIFAVGDVLVVSNRRLYLGILDENSTVDCLRLKRPGAASYSEAPEEIVPKGKMPQGKMPAEAEYRPNTDERIPPSSDPKGRIRP